VCRLIYVTGAVERSVNTREGTDRITGDFHPGPNHPSVLCIEINLSLRIKRSEREDDQWPQRCYDCTEL
jgi:hypothetical protein